MNLNEAIYIGQSIKLNDNQIIFKDRTITHLQIIEAVSILSNQLTYIQNKCNCFECTDFQSLTHKTDNNILFDVFKKKKV